MASSSSTGIELNEIADRIARVAARLFAADGYDATSVRNIVEAAEVTKPTMYYYFASKEALAQSLLSVAIEKLAAGLRQVLAGPGSATDKLVAVVEEHFRLCRDDPDRARFAYAVFFGPRSSHLASVLADFGQSLADLVAQSVGLLVGERIVAAERIEECTAAVRGLITIYTMDYLYRGQELDAGLARRLVVDLLEGFGRRESHVRADVQRN